MAGFKRRSPKGGGGSSSKVVSDNLKNGEEYEARLVYVADLGLQERNFKGEEKPPAQQLALGLEILGEVVEWDDGTIKPKLLWTNPFYVYHEMSDKGKEYMYYKIFSPSAEPETVADWESVLGESCNVVIKHGESKGNIYDNIAGIMSISKKYKSGVAEATIEPCLGDADDESNPATKSLYGLTKWVLDKRLNEESLEDYSDEPREEYKEEDIPF